MPSNHISNEPYHEWLRDTARRKEEEQKIANEYVSTRPLPKGGWEIVVRVDSDDELPVTLRKVYDSIGKRED
jgi:hypothetical protein